MMIKQIDAIGTHCFFQRLAIAVYVSSSMYLSGKEVFMYIFIYSIVFMCLVLFNHPRIGVKSSSIGLM